MPNEQILDNDIVCRTMMDPKDVSVFAGMPQLDVSKNLNFSPANKKTGLREESVNCLRLFEGEDKAVACHKQGKKQCDGRNDGRKDDKNFCLFKYAGFTTAIVSCIREIRHKEISFDVLHTPKNDNYAHCDMVMVNGDQDEMSKREARMARKMAKELLVKCFTNETKLP